MQYRHLGHPACGPAPWNSVLLESWGQDGDTLPLEVDVDLDAVGDPGNAAVHAVLFAGLKGEGSAPLLKCALNGHGGFHVELDDLQGNATHLKAVNNCGGGWQIESGKFKYSERVFCDI